jgi:hypothetical protein
VSLDDEIAKIRDDTVRQIMQVCQRRKEYPKDCIVDGALEKLVKYITMMEEKCGK